MRHIGPKSNIRRRCAPLQSAQFDYLAFQSMQSTTAERCAALSKSKPRIAIVDDDESVCRAVRRLVRSLGMDGETFSSGQNFLDMLEAMPSFRPDCLILDVQMPGMNGLAVQDRLARSGKNVPVIFITAHDEVGVREKALGAGAVAFLRKPFDDELLVKTLNEALKRTQTAQHNNTPK